MAAGYEVFRSLMDKVVDDKCGGKWVNFISEYLTDAIEGTSTYGESLARQYVAAYIMEQFGLEEYKNLILKPEGA